MRVLFDDNLPHKLRNALDKGGRHEMVTASFLGWGHLKNGELLSAAEEAGFEVFVTGDRTIEFEQNLQGRRMAIIALSTNNWPIVKSHVEQILTAINIAAPGSFRAVDCGLFSRKRELG